MNSKISHICLHEGLNLKSAHTFCKRCGVIMNEQDVVTVKVNQAIFPSETNPYDLLEQMQINSLDFKKYKDQLKEDEWSSIKKERAANIEILKQFNTLCKYSEKTFHLSSLYLDIITIKLRLVKQKFQFDKNLLIIGCMIIASKFIENEFDPNLIETQKWNFSFYSLESILKYEIICVKLLDHKLNYTTAYDFAQFFLYHGIILASETPQDRLETINQRVMDTLASFLSNERFLEFEAIQIASSCIYLTRDFYSFTHWDESFYLFYKIKSDLLKECFELIRSPQISPTVYLKKKILTESKTKLSKIDLCEVLPIDSNPLNIYVNESIEYTPRTNGVKTIYTKVNDKINHNIFNEYKRHSKIGGMNKHISIVDSDESNTENGDKFADNKIYIKHRQKYGSCTLSSNHNKTVYYGKSKNFGNDKNILKEELGKMQSESKIKNVSDLRMTQTRRMSGNLKIDFNQLKMFSFSNFKNRKSDHINEIMSNASTAANSIKSVYKDTTINPQNYASVKKDEIAKDTKYDLILTNKIQKIKSVLSNKHNFSFNHLKSMDFDINKVLENTRNSELKINKKTTIK